MAKSVEEELKELQGQFDAKQQQIKILTNDSSDLKRRIDENAKKVNDVKQVSDPYKQLLDNIRTEKEGIAAIAIQKTAMVNAELDDNAKQNIKAKIKDVDDAIKELENEKQTKIDNVVDINNKITQAKEDIENKKTVFESLKNYQKTVEEDLKQLKDLKTALQKEESTKILFFLLEDLGNIKDKSYDSSETLKSKLYEAQSKLEAAKAHLSEEEGELKTAKADLDAKTKEKDMKIKSRKTDIIDQIK
jgi:chromosome segregation ATPase